MRKQTTSYRDPRNGLGLSRSAWVSLAVKALRLGWPAGLRAAEERSGKTAMKGVMTVGLFEDVFPTDDDLDAMADAVRALDYETLAAYQTHHGRYFNGRALTDSFCDLAAEAVAAAKAGFLESRAGFALRDRLGLWLPPRAGNVAWTWLKIRPRGIGMTRTLDTAEFVGMPPAILDMHTREGRARHTGTTILSGTYEQHRKLGRLVRDGLGGWESIRREVHGEKPVVQESNRWAQARFAF